MNNVLFIVGVVIGLGFVGLFFLMINYESNLPPHWEDICIESHAEMSYTTTFVNGNISMHPFFYDVCDKTQRKCVVGSNYDGPKECMAY
jgi:hypothetical protein